MSASPKPQVAIGRAIGLRRRDLDLSQETLAHAVGMSVRGLRKIEAGKGNPTWHTADTIARALGWSIAELAEKTVELETKDRKPINKPLRGH